MSFLDNPELKRKAITCYYCGLYDERVEAGGVWYCPNPICQGPGGAWFRRQLKSYREVEGGRHTVDTEELIDAGERHLEELNECPERDAVCRSLEELRSRQEKKTMKEEHDCPALKLGSKRLRWLIKKTLKTALKTDENIGDARETFDSILYWTSRGKQGQCWGHCHHLRSKK